MPVQMPAEVPTYVNVLVVMIVLAILYVAGCVRVIKEYERGVVFHLGRVLPTPFAPGLAFVFWPFERLERVSLRTCVYDVPVQDLITKDDASVRVNAVVYYRVVDPMKAVLEVEDHGYAMRELSQAALRSVVARGDLHELLAEHERWSRRLQEVIAREAGAWGVEVTLVELKRVDEAEAHRPRVVAHDLQLARAPFHCADPRAPRDSSNAGVCRVNGMQIDGPEAP